MSSPLTLLDEETPSADPLAGTMIGSCEIVGSLIPGKPGSALLAFKLDLTGGASETVLLRKLDDGQPPPGAVADAEDAAGLSDSHLERVFGIEVSELGSYWVTEYVPGATLDEVRLACKQNGMTLPMGFGLAAIADAALGLHQLHTRQNAREPLRQRAHGMLLPQHVVVTFPGSSKLLNPRYLKPAPSGAVDAAWFAGNAGYLAPESIRGEPVDPRSDVFSLGVLVHELLTNKILFNGRTPRDRADATLRGAEIPPSRLNLSLNPQVDAAVMRALSLDPGQRYPNAGDFHRALKQAVGPYMWKEAQRAELMERIFATRSRRTKELAILMKERETAAIIRVEEAKRAAEQARAAEAAARAAAEAAERAAQQQAEEAARRAAQQRAAVKSAAAAPSPAARPAARLPVPMIAIAGVPALVVVAVVGWFVFRSPPPAPDPIPEPPPPVVAPSHAEDAGTEAADAGEASDAGAADAGDGGTESADGGPPKKKKKKSNVVVPPWLRR